MAIAFSVAFTASPLAALTKLLVEATPQLSAGVSFVSRTKFRKVFLGAAATATPANILAGYNAAFGSLVSGRQIFLRLTVVSSDGQRSAPFIVAVPVV